ncbi:MAG TPA: sugar transferase [Allosphingosinicella sp.]|nr:sugar transferase [Allosphingosinicella sp.]
MGSHAALKRATDLAICLALLVPGVLLCLPLMLLIRLESRGSPLFVQLRVGRAQRPFRMLKLRTMAAGTGDLPSHDVGRHRITRVGRSLRRWKLDELPQLLNVLVGSMSLVGPRPCLPSQSELIAARAERDLFVLRPGVTGPGQLAGVDMSEPARLAAVEADYFRRATPLSDLRLMVGTVLGSGAGDAAARETER